MNKIPPSGFAQFVGSGAVADGEQKLTEELKGQKLAAIERLLWQNPSAAKAATPTGMFCPPPPTPQNPLG
jgi:hypothetical protein